jgi:hypothetical protein
MNHKTPDNTSSIVGILGHYNERKNPIVFQDQRSKLKVVESLTRQTL